MVVFHSSHAMAVFQISWSGTTIDPTSCGWTISQEALGATDSWYAEVRNLAKLLVTSRQTLDCVPHSYFKTASTGEASMAWGRRKQHKTKTNNCYFDVCRSMALWKAGQSQANMSWLHLRRDGYYCPQSHPNYCCIYKASCILLSCPAKFFWNASKMIKWRIYANFSGWFPPCCLTGRQEAAEHRKRRVSRSGFVHGLFYTLPRKKWLGNRFVYNNN